MTIQDIATLPYEEPRKINLGKWKIYDGSEVSFSNNPKKKEWIHHIDAIKIGDIIFTSFWSSEFYAGVITEKNGSEATAIVKIDKNTYYCTLEFGKDDRCCWANVSISTINASAITVINIV